MKIHSENSADTVQDLTNRTVNFVKSKIFDFIAILLIFGLIAISLGVLERREITLETLSNIIVDIIPFYFLAILLNTNYYTKGAFAGKNTNKFIFAQQAYSKLINDLDGDHIDKCDDFCKHYNETALINIRTIILKEAAIPYDKYENKWKNKKGVECLPLKICDKNIIIDEYGKIGWKIILKARRIKIKTINVNKLLTSNSTTDPTDVGKNETQLKNNKLRSTAMSYLFSIALLSLLGVRDITQWGWSGIVLILFKVIYVFCRAYMVYFDGYNDITLNVVNYINRKSDIIKQFNSWYNNEYIKSKQEDKIL